MAKEPRIIVIGSINMGMSLSIDRMPQKWEIVEASATRLETDGRASRIATAAVQFGAQASIVGKVGSDGYGTTILESLKQAGINTHAVSRVQDVATGLSLLMRNEKRETWVVSSAGANKAYQEGEIAALEPFIAQHQLLVITNTIPLCSVMEAVKIAKEHHMLVVMDPHPAHTLPDEIFADVDILLPGEADIRHLFGTDVIDLKSSRLALSHFLERGVKRAAVLKIGIDGVLIATHNEFITLGSVSISDSIDIKGDRDIFSAALSSALSQNTNLYQACVYARGAAQLSSMESGIRATFPTREALAEFMRQNPMFHSSSPPEA